VRASVATPAPIAAGGPAQSKREQWRSMCTLAFYRPAPRRRSEMAGGWRRQGAPTASRSRPLVTWISCRQPLEAADHIAGGAGGNLAP
jgi:hypothetical protein